MGYGTIVASRAVVTKDIEPYPNAGGNSAQLIRKRFDDETIQKLINLAGGIGHWKKLSLMQKRLLKAIRNCLMRLKLSEN